MLVCVCALIGKTVYECLIGCSLDARLMGYYFIGHNSSLVCMAGITYVYIDTVFGSYGYFLLSCVFEHDRLDIRCFACLICMCFVFLYLHLFSAIEHV